MARPRAERHRPPARRQEQLRHAFTLLREARSDAGDDEERAQSLEWAQHAFANRLVDTLGEDPENPARGVEAARFVVDGLQFEHAPSLRLLSEHTAVKDGDPVGAARLLKRALAVDATDPESHFLAARLFARMGKKPQVLSHLQKAIDNAAGTMPVRSMARFEADFDGLRGEPDFAELTDIFPADPTLRALYEALDAGELTLAASLADQALDDCANPLDVLYPWREAVEQQLAQTESEENDPALLEAMASLQSDIETREDDGEESAAYARFSGDT